MTCAQCRELLDAFIDGELPGEDMAAVREHIASCPSARANTNCSPRRRGESERRS